MRLRIFLIALVALLLPLSAAARVVIAEVMWSGTDLSGLDEWIELANTGTGTVSMSGWTITKFSEGEEVVMLRLPPGSAIGSGKTFLISNFGEAASRLGVEPGLVDTAVSLSNTQLLLRLYAPRTGHEASSGQTFGELLDIVDDGVGVPFAGSNDVPKASMERIDLAGSGALKANWRTATTFWNFDDGAALFGTPGAPNGMGPSLDTFPPKEATDFRAEYRGEHGSGTIAVRWTPSRSLDLASQELTTDPGIMGGSGTIMLPSTATGITFPMSGTGIRFTLRSMDGMGNISPGTSTVSVPAPRVRITEVLANPAGTDDLEWIELGNLGSTAVDIAGWILDEENSSPEYRITPAVGTAFLLLPGEHVAFRKTRSGLPLENGGERLTLRRGTELVDTWAYPEAIDGVSFGRDPLDPERFRSFCVPTEGAPNTVIPLDPRIVIQSGMTTGTDHVTLNLEAAVAVGSSANAACSWQYGDGFTSLICNPPSHTFTSPGAHAIRLTFTDACGATALRTLDVTVLASTSAVGSGGSGGGGGGGSSGGTGGGSVKVACSPTILTGIRVSEILPNPSGDDALGEWIELENTTEKVAQLCGWVLDDGEEGSSPHKLDHSTIPPQGFLRLPRSETRIAVNNDKDHVRLFAPGGGLAEDILMEEGKEDESFALRSDGIFVWTPYLTPGSVNRFRTAERAGAGDTLVIAAVLPNPEGKDEGQEWVEIANLGEEAVSLAGWQLDNREGGSEPYRIGAGTLRPGDIRRFGMEETGLEFRNTEDAARLLDPDGAIISALAWRDAVSGRIYRPGPPSGEDEAEVTNVVDGDTIDVVIAGKIERVRLIGVDTPETVHPLKPVERFGKEASAFTRQTLMGKTVILRYEAERRDKYDRLLAYVILDDGTNVNGELIRRGYGFAYLRFPFGLAALFAGYEEEAKRAKLGLWADPVTTTFVAEIRAAESEVLPNGEQVTATGGHLIEVATLTGTLTLTTEGAGILFLSEVVSNPSKEGPLAELGEYIELFNGGASPVPLGGWILDDAPKGSKPYVLPKGSIIAPQGHLVLPGGQTKLKLNNDGDEVSLTAPDGTVMRRVTIPKMKPGEAYAFMEVLEPQWCRTTAPTPGMPNTCVTPIAAVHVVQHSEGKRDARGTASVRVLGENTTSNAHSPTLPVRYRSILPALPAKETTRKLPPLLVALLPKMVDPALPPLLASTGNAKRSLSTTSGLAALALLLGVIAPLTATTKQR